MFLQNYISDYFKHQVRSLPIHRRRGCRAPRQGQYPVQFKSQLDLLDEIVKSPPPELPSSFSAEVRDCVKRALGKPGFCSSWLAVSRLCANFRPNFLLWANLLRGTFLPSKISARGNFQCCWISKARPRPLADPWPASGKDPAQRPTVLHLLALPFLRPAQPVRLADLGDWLQGKFDAI